MGNSHCKCHVKYDKDLKEIPRRIAKNQEFRFSVCTCPFSGNCMEPAGAFSLPRTDLEVMLFLEYRAQIIPSKCVDNGGPHDELLKLIIFLLK